MNAKSLLASVGLACGLLVSAAAQAADPLPSWNETVPKKAIVSFVGKITKVGSPDFVPPAGRIAVFDNDGTLWAEQPMYFQLAFALDRVKALAPEHPAVRSPGLCRAIPCDVQGVSAEPETRKFQHRPGAGGAPEERQTITPLSVMISPVGLKR